MGQCPCFHSDNWTNPVCTSCRLRRHHSKGWLRLSMRTGPSVAIISDHHPLPQRPGAPAGPGCALPYVPGRHLIDLLGPAPLERVADVELQPPNSVDLNDGMLAVLQRSDALVVGTQEKEIPWL